MTRPGFVLEVDEKTPRLLTFAGATLRLDSFGLGAKVVYPPDAVASSDPVALIDQALEAPVGADPLPARLNREVRLTIVVLDDQRPQPRMRFDVRRSIVERVLEHAARAGVDDVQIVIATGLSRRWHHTDISATLGDRVATSFLPDGLVTSHDVTGDDMVTIGEVDGQAVRINRRVATSDVVVSVGVTSGDGPSCGLSLGLSDVATIDRLAGLNRDEDVSRRIIELVQAQVPHYSITAVLGQGLPGPQLAFMAKREWEWRLADKLAYASARQFVAGLPKQGAQKLFAAPQADYAISDLIGGDPAAVRVHARDAWRAANSVELSGPSDVLSVSVWGGAFDPGNPVGSPLNAAWDALVRQAGSHTATPLVRDGGVLIARHPLVSNFSNRTQSASADFFATVLPETLEPALIAERHEPAAMVDPWYLKLYREHLADHPLRVFHTWYQLQRASERLGDVIWVGADRRTAAVLGHRAATTFADALEIASNSVGPHPSITHLHGPGRVLGIVR